MMNNIEILEEYIKEVWKPKPIHNVIPDWATIEKEEIQAIENLIQEYKELKKQMGKDLDVVYIKGVYDERDKWKNKIKEKIRIRKEEKAECKNSNQAKLILREIYILQELLEEGE